MQNGIKMKRYRQVLCETITTEKNNSVTDTYHIIEETSVRIENQ